MPSILNVFIADDEEFFRTGIELNINAEKDMQVIGTAGDGIEAINNIRKTQPDVVLMDIQMPRMNGIETIKQLKKNDPDMLILILTTFNEEEYIIEGLAHGANGYLIKGIDFQLLIRTIREVAKGQYLLPTEVATKLAMYVLKRRQRENVLPDFIYSSNTFTKRELDILTLLAKRYANKEMAKEMSLGEGTMRNYLTVIYHKLGVNNRQEAISILLQEEE